MANEFYVIYYKGKPWSESGLYDGKRGLKPYKDIKSARASLTIIKRNTMCINLDAFEIVRYVPEKTGVANE